uniref:Uncharacterized protein n=1 Tax=Anguilla anguilla TaxID=7936 RepID=A0A0E9U5F5_ANGAN
MLADWLASKLARWLLPCWNSITTRQNTRRDGFLFGKHCPVVRSDLTVMTMKLFLCRTCQGFHLFTFHGGQLPTYFVAQL